MLVGFYPGSRVALAHGKELRMEVSSFAPDPQEPLVRLYRVFVIYAGDGEPVTGARVQLTAERQGGGPPMGPIFLEPLNEPGLYAAQLTYSMYGSWDVALKVEEQGEGEGEASFIEELVPAGPTTDIGEVRQRVLELFFRFNWWDVVAIAVRISHSLAAVVWFGLTGVILVAYGFLQPALRAPLYRRLSRVFLPAATLSLAALAASGAYTAIFSAPIKPPGVFDLDVMWRIPFGPHYLGTIAFKALALGTCAILAWRMAQALMSASLPVPAGGGTVAMKARDARTNETVAVIRDVHLFRLAVANAMIGVLLAADVALAIYLHYISHLAVFLPD
ncbi:MAG: FixH family protein [Dehalococcoidia bacterium]